MGQDKEPDYVKLREDRRKDLRSQLLVLKVSSEDKKTFFGYGKTLSKSGMFISTVNPRAVGEEFAISFKLPDDQTEVNAGAVWHGRGNTSLQRNASREWE
jgi:hypothetical protein